MARIVVQRAKGGGGEVGTLQKREAYIHWRLWEWVGSVTVNKQGMLMINDRIANWCDWRGHCGSE